MAGLLAKGMAQHENHHHMLTKTVDGVTEVVTRMSHDGKKEISGTLAKLMGHQCFLHPAEFWNLIDCPLSEDAWKKLIAERCVDGRNPFIGH